MARAFCGKAQVLNEFGMQRTGVRRISIALWAAFIFAVLAGCQSGAPDPVVEKTTVQAVESEEPLFVAEPGLSASDRLRKAIDLLALGNAGQAEAEL